MARMSRLAAAAGLLLGLAGCGPAQGNSPAQSNSPETSAASSGPGASTPARSASRSSAPAPAGLTGGTTIGGAPPAGFAATSVTFVSADEAFVLGTAPCAHAPCTSIARTPDRGRTWHRLPAPPEPVGEPGTAGAPVVWGIRFATPEHGFVFGDGLWETADGGRRWIRDAVPAGAVLSLAIVGGQVLALTAGYAPGGRLQPAFLEHRALSGGPWRAIRKDTFGNLIDPDDLIATQAGVAAVVQGPDVIVTADGGFTFTDHRVPCGPPAGEPSVAVTSVTGLALLCTGDGFTGHTLKQVYLSADDGAHWAPAGQPSAAGDGGTIAAATAGQQAIATESAASWLFSSTDDGTSWRIAASEDDGGMGWADLGFTTATDGVVVRGPADSDGNATRRPGQLFLTSDAGTTWYQVSFSR